MAKATKSRQISFFIPDRAGLLSEVTAAIGGVKVNITAVCAYAMENTAHFMLTTDNNAKAKKALAQLRAKVKEDDVVTVEMPNKVGELHKVAKKIADAGIYISYMYGTTATGKSSTCVLKTSDDKKAIGVINK